MHAQALRPGEVSPPDGLKPFVDVALACMVLSRNRALRSRSQVRALFAALADALRARDPTALALRDHRLFSQYLTLAVAMAASGADMPEWRRAVRSILSAGYVEGMDRSACGRMELRYLLDLGGFPSRLPKLALLYRDSIAHALPPLPYVHTGDLYDFTHVLFYLSDFGRHPLRPILSERFDATREYTAAATSLALRDANWDLAGELLISCWCLDRYEPPISKIAWRALREAQAEGGYIRMKSDGARSFATKLHATLVALLAASLWHSDDPG